MTERNYAEELGTPFIEDFSENGHRVRRNLLFVGIITLAILQFDLELKGPHSFIGLKIEGLETIELYWIFLALTSYHLIHFLLVSAEHLARHKLRVTGTWKAFNLESVSGVGGFDSKADLHEAPNDHRQATLYSWAETFKHITALQEALETADKDMQINRLSGETKNSIHTLMQQFASEFGSLAERLKRFEGFFNLYVFWNSIRWLSWEFGIPVAIGAINTVWLLKKIIC